MTRFAKLINFTIKTMKRRDWQPFLLKDPVFLTAHISSIDVKSKIRLFITTNSIATTKIIGPSSETISTETISQQRARKPIQWKC